MEVQKMKHVCKFCKKSFPCGRSLGGHIRSHLPKPGYELRENPKKTWRVAHDHEDVLLNNSTAFSSSSTETENPKSSKVNQNQGKRSNFARNNSHSSVSEVVEAEHQQEEVVVAMCLIMLSQDVGSWGKISSSFTATATESSENNSLHQGKKSKCRKRREKIQGNVSVSVAANGEKFESTACGYLQKGLKLKGIEVSANGFCSKDKNNKSSESKRNKEKDQGKESEFGATDHAVKSAKVESVASGYDKDGAKTNEYEVLGNGFVSNDKNNQTPESKRKFIGQSKASGNVRKWSKLEEYEVSENGFSSYDQKNNSNDDHDLDSELFNDMSKTNCFKRSKFECTTCNKVFHSYQALGGHRASHKKLLGGGKCSPTALQKLEAETDIDTDDVAQSTDVEQQTQSQQQEELVANNNMVNGSSSSSSFKKVVQKHECPICFRVFSSGQALGGHKRSHLLVASNKNAEINGRISELKTSSQNNISVDVVERLSSTETRDLLDLNFPPAQDETATAGISSNSLIGFMKPHWCAESSHKHEPLLGLISN